MDNVLQEGIHEAYDVTKNDSTALTSGRIVLGQHFANMDHNSFSNGALLCDWLAIWDRPLTEKERNVFQQN